MSKLRPTLRTTNEPNLLSENDQFFRIMQAVSKHRELIHGSLRSNGEFCAIGYTFEDGVKVLDSGIVDEVAAYNDSFPHVSKKERWRKVMSWLRWKNGLTRPKKTKP